MNGHAPGVESRSIRAVEPFHPVPEHAWAVWPCTRCGEQFQMHQSHLVTFASGDRELGFVVCPGCAELYRSPSPVTIDLARIPSPTSSDHPGIRQVAAHVDYVRRSRARPPGGALQLRGGDVRLIALAADLTPAGLVELLQRRETLIPT